ncbi:flp pilus-assembly TadE/G-like family protein [Rhodococcus spelaei]|uniref:Flp pilus-assembly TadE/G-like family protein n=1 Tax=Rhodococcus spelaei TaxID=2546320 RepID=A0A541BRP4_9NOCA|nr:Rv3654c family TadE-like protein [Rhodococcus spelaei]TQF74983.1 flp pilus-assembly TadE/G-like family protein [Rhodococcus spelaei]
MRDERGSATVLACFAMLALISLTLVVGHLGAAVAARHRAQAAADLGALAAAAAVDRGEEAACAAARAVADRMVAALRECRIEGWDAVVTVGARVGLAAVGTGDAVAAARAGPVDLQ